MTSNDVAIKISSKVILIEPKLKQLEYSVMKSHDDLFFGHLVYVFEVVH
jgi:hypothetical protein